MLGKRSRLTPTDSSKSRAMPGLSEKPYINLPLSPTFSEPEVPKSPTSPLDFKISPTFLKSPRGFHKRDSEAIGLAIVAAMNKTNDTHDAFPPSKSGRTAITAGSVKNPPISPKSQPIPIVSDKNLAKTRTPKLEKNEMELSESYTCVIYRYGPNSIKKTEYFRNSEESWGNSEIFCKSPPEISEIPVKDSIFEPAKFLSSCYLCRKKLQGRDIFMYRGDKAFCSVECRYQQIISDEQKDKCGSEALKPFDYSVSPCSAPRLFFAGVAAA